MTALETAVKSVYRFNVSKLLLVLDMLYVIIIMIIIILIKI